STFNQADPMGPTRSVRQLFGTLADRTVTFGPVPATPTVTFAGTAPYAQPRLQGAVQAEYNRHWSVGFTQTNAPFRSAAIIMTEGYRGGGGTVDLRVPDLSGAAGWQN